MNLIEEREKIAAVLLGRELADLGGQKPEGFRRSVAETGASVKTFS